MCNLDSLTKGLDLQRPLSNDALRIVASGEKEDGPRQDAMPSPDQARIKPQCFPFDTLRRFRPYPRRDGQPFATALSRAKPATSATGGTKKQMRNHLRHTSRKN